MSHAAHPDNLEKSEIGVAKMDKEIGYDHNGVSPVETDHTAVGRVNVIDNEREDEIDYGDLPTEEELHTLRRVSGKINWACYSVAFCELAERFSYYGATIVYTNFIVQPLPEGSNTGAGFSGQSGALHMGPKAGQGLYLFNQFFAYLTPLFGAYVADARLGRYKTIHIAIVVSIVGHLVLVAAAAPAVIVNQKSSLAALLIGMIILGVGTGFFKANIAPLLGEQAHDRRMRVETRKNGERVIIDPAVTNTRLFLYFYLCINVGSLTGQISMVYAEKYVGFWLSFLLPTVLFVASPIILALNKKRYRLNPPTGSVLGKCFKMFGYVMRGRWTLNIARLRREFTWDIARPSTIPVDARPPWMTYDDAWVDEVRRGLKACKVFLFLPIFFLAYNQMTNNLTTQASTMQLNGVPNDIIQNLNPLSIMILIPLLDGLVYPALRKAGIHLTPIKRMAMGFLFSAASMIAATVTQVYIYRMGPCGEYPGDDVKCAAPINVWVQSLPYILVGISEILTNTTSLEYAFSKAPENMKSLVMSVNLLMSAISSALGQALLPLAADPLLVWNYGLTAIIAGLAGPAFWLCFRKLDRDEDKWNSIKKTKYLGQNRPTAAPGHPVQGVAMDQREVENSKLVV